MPSAIRSTGRRRIESSPVVEQPPLHQIGGQIRFEVMDLPRVDGLDRNSARGGRLRLLLARRSLRIVVARHQQETHAFAVQAEGDRSVFGQLVVGLGAGPGHRDEGRIERRQEEAVVPSRCPSRQLGALEQRDRRSSPRQLCGAGATDDATSDHDDSGRARARWHRA